MHTLNRNWWLLAFCGILNAMYAAGNLFMQDADGSLVLRTYAVQSTVVSLGRIVLAAGVCAIAAALWRSGTGRSWFLAVYGAAGCALGVILNGAFGDDIMFRTIALLIVVMAVSSGVFELLLARNLGWMARLAGSVSIGFGLLFFAWAFRWIDMQPRPGADFIWFGSYFGFSAVCFLALAIWLRWARGSLGGRWDAVPGHAS